MQPQLLSRRRVIRGGVTGFVLLSGCTFLDSKDELADLLVSNRTEKDVSADVVVTHLDSGSVVFDREVRLGASSQREYQDPFNRTGEHHVEVTTTNDLTDEYRWTVRPESGGRNTEMLIITIETAEIRFSVIE